MLVHLPAAGAANVNVQDIKHLVMNTITYYFYLFSETVTKSSQFSSFLIPSLPFASLPKHHQQEIYFYFAHLNPLVHCSTCLMYQCSSVQPRPASTGKLTPGSMEQVLKCCPSLLGIIYPSLLPSLLYNLDQQTTYLEYG